MNIFHATAVAFHKNGQHPYHTEHLGFGTNQAQIEKACAKKQLPLLEVDGISSLSKSSAKESPPHLKNPNGTKSNTIPWKLAQHPPNHPE